MGEEVTKEKPAKPQIDPGELVKQDLRKIVTSVEYFDEEKFEGGKKIKSFHKKQKEAEAEEANKANTIKEDKVTLNDSVDEVKEDTPEAADSTHNSNKRKSSGKKRG